VFLGSFLFICWQVGFSRTFLRKIGENVFSCRTNDVENEGIF